MAALKRRWASPEGAPEDAIADAWAIDGAPVDGGGDLPVVRLEPKCLVKAKPKPKWFGREAEVLDVIDNQRGGEEAEATPDGLGRRGNGGFGTPVAPTRRHPVRPPVRDSGHGPHSAPLHLQGLHPRS